MTQPWTVVPLSAEEPCSALAIPRFANNRAPTRRVQNHDSVPIPDSYQRSTWLLEPLTADFPGQARIGSSNWTVTSSIHSVDAQDPLPIFACSGNAIYRCPPLPPLRLGIAHFRKTHFARDAEPTIDEGDGSTRAQRRPASGGGGQYVCVLTRSACASPDRSGHQPGSLCNTAEATPLVPNEHFAGPFGWSGASRGFSRGRAYVAVHAAISRALRQRRSG